MNKETSTLEVEPGKLLRVYSREETANFAKQWMEVFGKDKHGINTKAYMWHIFGFEKYPSISGVKAVEKYKQQVAHEYIVLANDRVHAIATDALPETGNASDYYVFPSNLAWTMAMTHEDGWLGPYFAVHLHYDALHKKNLDQIRKKQEIENAKRRGWL